MFLTSVEINGKWRAVGLTAQMQFVNDEKTLAYMSVRGYRYKVTEISGSYPDHYEIIRETVYEPDPALIEKYKNYFLEVKV